MKKRVFFCNIVKTDGLYYFRPFEREERPLDREERPLECEKNPLEHDENPLSGIQEADKEIEIEIETNIIEMSTIDDIVSDLLFINPDVLVIFMYSDTIELVMSILSKPEFKGFKDAVIYCTEICENCFIRINDSDRIIINDLSLLRTILSGSACSETTLIGAKSETASQCIGSEALRRIDIVELLKYKKETYSENYSKAMSNGLNSFMTGVYFSEKMFEGAKHVLIDTFVSPEKTEFLKDAMSVNSAIFEVGGDHRAPPESMNAQEPKRSYFNHIHLISDGGLVRYDGFASGYKEEFQKIKLSSQEYAAGAFKKNTFFEITNNDDLMVFEEGLARFSNEGKFSYMNRLVNTCMWLKSKCTLLKLTRFVLMSSGEIRPCFNCSKSIGIISDDMFPSLKNCSTLMKAERIKRGCSDCVADKRCARCALLPDGIDTAEYCRIVKEYEALPEYMLALSVFNELLPKFKLWNKMSINDLEISHFRHPLACPFVKESGDYGFRLNVFMFKLIDDYYAFSFNMSKLLRVDKKLVFIVEAVNRGFSDEEIIGAYCDAFAISKATARGHVDIVKKQFETAI
ncbi:MAG: hypothetical protein FWH52_00155 [Synergistaceae bacterium]|nr:hypothetical protein [Synergistaceae bacterium]